MGDKVEKLTFGYVLGAISVGALRQSFIEDSSKEALLLVKVLGLMPKRLLHPADQIELMLLPTC